MANPQIIVEYVAKTDQLVKGMRSAGKETESFGGRMKGMGKAALVAGGAAGVAALAASVKIGVDEMTEAAKVGAQTEAVLKSTGGAAGVSSKQVADLAESLMKKSGVDDEAIQSGENLLLTFTNLQNRAGKGNDIFNQATKAMLDMSVALGTDTKTSAIQLGKALNDPLKGVTKLQKIGVTFTEGQKRQIEAMVKAGDTAGAQKVILEELNREFGGSAEAAGKTLPGQINVLKESFSNLAGELLGTLLPSLSAVVGALTAHPTLFKTLAIGVLAVAAAMVVLNVAMAITAANPITLVILGIIAAVVALAVAVVWLVKNWDKVTAALVKGFDKVKAAALAVFGWIRANWPLILGILAGPLGLAVALVIRNWDRIKAAITAAVNAVLNVVRNVFNTVRSFLSSVTDAIGGVLRRLAGLFDRPADAARDAAGAVKKALGGMLDYIEGLVGKVRSAASSVANAIKGPLNSVLGAWNSISLTVPRVTIPSFKIGPKKFGGGSFGGQTISFPNVPLLASGGIVTQPTLAMVGERGPEAVIPLGRGGGAALVEIGQVVIREELDLARLAARLSAAVAVRT